MIRTRLDRLGKMIQGHFRSNHYDFKMISDAKFHFFSLFDNFRTRFFEHGESTLRKEDNNEK